VHVLIRRVFTAISYPAASTNHKRRFSASRGLLPHDPASRSLQRTGIAATIGAFAIWGFFPLYLKALSGVPAMQLVAHRVSWACLLVLGWMAARGELAGFRAALARRDVLLRLAATAVLVSINWLAYVWAVGNERVVETSLGYFINPLLNVVLGVIVLSERLNRMQWCAVALAAAGVVYLTITAGHPPWIALTLALSFGLYGLVRKTAQVDALPGLAVETALLAPLAIGYLVWCELAGIGVLGDAGTSVDLLLVASGAVTAIPLFLFAYGARRLPYSTVGVLQYIAPSLQLACGVFVFGEPFGGTRAIGFALIWAALLIYGADGLWRAGRAAPASA
jgi:chloramphenicol-sensitive protein RarD